MSTKIYKCHVCGNIVIKLHDSNITPQCCNRAMEELAPNIEGDNSDVHIPWVSRIDCSTIKVVIGRTLHPMTMEHYVQSIILETTTGFQVRQLRPYCQPEAIFFTTDTPVAIYAFCNIHGLWKTDVPTNSPKQHCHETPSSNIQ